MPGSWRGVRSRLPLNLQGGRHWPSSFFGIWQKPGINSKQLLDFVYDRTTHINKHYHTTSLPPTTNPNLPSNMSFFGIGGGRPQPSSAEKIAAIENEMKIVFDMQSRCVHHYARPSQPLPFPSPSLTHTHK